MNKPSKETIQTLMAHATQNNLTMSDLDELVHDLKSGEASDINNSTMGDQLSYIIESLGPTEAMKKIDELIK